MKIGQYAMQLLSTTSLSDQEVLDKVIEKFPSCNTKLASISWYKSYMKKNKQQVVVVERTAQVITNEIEALKSKLEELELELEMKNEEELDKNMKEFERLKKLLNVE